MSIARAQAEAIANRIAEARVPYAVFVRGSLVTWAPDASIAATRLRSDPQCAALEIGVFGTGHAIESIERELRAAGVPA